MRHEIVIETRKSVEGGYFRAEVVQGPTWALNYATREEERRDAYKFLKAAVQDDRSFVLSGDTFDFMHVEA